MYVFKPSLKIFTEKSGRLLTFCHHLVAMHKKTFFARHAAEANRCFGWGTGVKTLSKAALSPVYLTAEYCTPIWFVALTRALYPRQSLESSPTRSDTLFGLPLISRS